MLRIGVIVRCQKIPKFDFQSQFSKYVENHRNPSYLVFIEQLRSIFFVIDIF
jgi:hypothetical protein